MKPLLKHYPPQGEARRVMTTKKKPTQQDSILNDVIHCARCGSGMVVKRGCYVCPNAGQAPTFCPTISVDGKRLTHQLIATLVNRVMSPDTLSEIVGQIRVRVDDNLTAQQDRLNLSETAIEELNNQKLSILEKVEHGEITYPEAAPQLDAIQASQAGFVYESDVSRKEMDKLYYVADEDAIRSVAQDMATYTELADPTLAKELVNTFIEHVSVSLGSVEITYTHPIPGEQADQLVTSETFPLPQTAT